MRERCRELAIETVTKNNTIITDENKLRIITDLASIMWVASNMSVSGAGEKIAQVNRVLEVCLDESRARLVDPANEDTFSKNVQVHMRHLEMDLRRGGAAQLGVKP